MNKIPITDNMIQWLANGERGSSSNTMFEHMTGIPCSRMTCDRSHPLDPSDFVRCRKLLERCPELLDHLGEMASVNPVWQRIVNSWFELCTLMDAECPSWRDGYGTAPRTYKRMKELGC